MKKNEIVKNLRAKGLNVNNSMTKAELKRIASASGFWNDAWDAVKNAASSVVKTVKKTKPLSGLIRTVTGLAAPLVNDILPVAGPMGVEYLGNKAADYVSNNWGVGMRKPKLKTMAKRKKGGMMKNNLLP